MIPDIIRSIAVRHLPGDLALVEIDRRDAAIWRLEQRQALHRQSTAGTGCCGASATTSRGRCRPFWSARLARDVHDVGARSARHQSDGSHGRLRGDIREVRLRIVRPSRPVRSAARRGGRQCRQGAFELTHHPRRKHRTELVLRNQLNRFGAQLRRKVDQIVDRDALQIERRRLGRKRLGRRIPFARHSALFRRASRQSARWVRRSRGSAHT